MFETLFGSEMPLAARFFIAFLVVLVLIGLTAWLVRRFGSNRLGGANARNRQPRLAVIDAASVDGRRRLVLIRRDNVEHLLMIGGPTDVVVEQNIVRGAAAREPARAEPAVTATPSSRQNESSWPLQPATESTPVAPPRPYRSSAADEPWHAPEPVVRPRAAETGSLTGLAAEQWSRLNPTEATAPAARAEPPVRAEPPARIEPPVRIEPQVRANPPPPAPPIAMTDAEEPAQDDRNLADMAHQLEAALRRAPMPEGRPPVTDPLAVSAPRMSDKAFDKPAFDKHADAPPRPPARDYKLRVDPRFDARPDARPSPQPELEPRLDVKPPAPAAAGKSAYDSLEEEMASLLGRPSGKT